MHNANEDVEFPSKEESFARGVKGVMFVVLTCAHLPEPISAEDDGKWRK